MSIDLQLKSSCSGCGTTTDLYGSNCKHMTMCLSCGKTMAENRGTCYECGTTITGLIREYVVRSSSSCDKNYSINRFVAGMPIFSKKESAENRWTMHKEGLQGRQVTDSLREKYKNRPWLLEDETGQSQFLGQLEGSQSATYYLLMMQGKEFVAIPAGSWYNFNKVAHYKQLTLEEAEEKMKNRRKTADGYQRWMMKTANNGPAAFGETELDDKESGGGSGGGGKTRKKNGDADEAHVSDRGEEDDEEEAMRKDRLGLNKKGAGDNDDEEEGLRGGDLDLDLDDDIEKGDDWEHDETFTDDDEALGNDPEEREDVDPEVPAPPEIKQDEEDEDETNEEEGGLSKSGKELQKLLGRTAGLNESDADDEDDDDDLEDDVNLPPVLASKPKEEPVDNSPAKPVPSGPSRATPPSSKSAKAKRKLNGDDPKPTNGAPKKVKTENDSKSVAKDEAVATKSGVAVKGTPSSSSKQGSASSAGPVTEDEIRATLLQKSPVTTQDLVANFKARLRTGEDKKAFAEILKRMSKIQKTNGSSYVVLREK